MPYQVFNASKNVAYLFALAFARAFAPSDWTVSVFM
jgi:hypothetical protein